MKKHFLHSLGAFIRFALWILHPELNSGWKSYSRACAVTMKSNGWRDGDFLRGMKVNAGAIGRLIPLVQEGYIQIEP